MLSVRDISLSGAFLNGDGTDLSVLTLGSEYGVTVIALGDLERCLEAQAIVVRHDPEGMAITWVLEAGAEFSVQQFLKHLSESYG